MLFKKRYFKENIYLFNLVRGCVGPACPAWVEPTTFTSWLEKKPTAKSNFNGKGIKGFHESGKLMFFDVVFDTNKNFTRAFRQKVGC